MTDPADRPERLAAASAPRGRLRPAASQSPSWSPRRIAIPPEHRGSLVEAELDAAFRWVAKAVGDRDVLVVESGSGEGAALLAAAGARSVVGVDHDRELVEAAERAFGGSVGFSRAEPMALPFAKDSFDAVVCFGVLEVAADPIAVLDGVRRILAPGGLLFCSLEVGTEIERELRNRFAAVSLHTRRLCLAAVVASETEEPAVPVDYTTWLTGSAGEQRGRLAVCSDAGLPETASVATLTGMRDLIAYRLTLEAWEERARRAEAEGSAKHWELVAARESQRRLRKRLHRVEHTKLKMLWRVLRGRPARLSPGPPIRASERGPEPWD